MAVRLNKGLKLATSTWDEKEIEAAKRILDSGNLTMGVEVSEFESEFAAKVGSQYAVMFNSGSSANLAMVFALKYFSQHSLKVESEIIVPAVSWSTTYFPVSQAGFTLRFVDIDKYSLNLQLEQVQKSINRSTGAIFAVNLLGNPALLESLRQLADSNNILLIEDNCESLGAQIDGKHTGTFGLAGSFSFYFSHHLCTMEGGMVATNSTEFREILISLRAHGWTRGLPKENHLHRLSSNPWEDLYRFVLPGFNLRPIEIAGAIGRVQLEKWDSIIEARRANAMKFMNLFGDSDWYRIQRENSRSSWFGFAFVLQNRLKGQRELLINFLESRGFETRPIVAGNFLRNPVMKHLKHIAEGSFQNANEIHTDGFFIGNHHYDISENLDELYDLFVNFEEKLPR